MNDKVICLLCNDTMAVRKEYNIRSYYETIRKQNIQNEIYFPKSKTKMMQSLNSAYDGNLIKSCLLVQPKKYVQKNLACFDLSVFRLKQLLEELRTSEEISKGRER